MKRIGVMLTILIGMVMSLVITITGPAWGDMPFDESPASPVDFGKVAVEDSRRITITLTNLDGPIVFEAILIEEDSNSAFSIVRVVPFPPAPLPGGNTIKVDVKFSPSSSGSHSAKLHVTSSWATRPHITLLSGNGILAGTIEEIIDFFDDSVTSGALWGIGPGASADGRLNAIRNMLEMAADLISIGEIADACVQLEAALGKCDGDPAQPDFVAGEAASVLNGMITDLMAELGCE